jgi:polyhydroxybutyrate depolymerase
MGFNMFKYKGLHFSIAAAVAILGLSAFSIDSHAMEYYETAKVRIHRDYPTTNPAYTDKIDWVYPNRPNQDVAGAIVVLHGGGGSKHGVAYALGVKTYDNQIYYTVAGVPAFNEDFIYNNNMAFIFVQGAAHASTPAETTWQNTMMESGRNDRALLQQIAQDLRTFGFPKVYLMGHSMGGVMTNRMWCEHNSAYDGYASSAGPMSKILKDGDIEYGLAACDPLAGQSAGYAAKKYMEIVGKSDDVIQFTNSQNALNLELHPAVVAKGYFYSPLYRHELYNFNFRATKICNQSVANPTADFTSACAGRLRRRLVPNADHCIKYDANDASCVTSLDSGLTAATGKSVMQTLVDFFKAP